MEARYIPPRRWRDRMRRRRTFWWLSLAALGIALLTVFAMSCGIRHASRGSGRPFAFATLQKRNSDLFSADPNQFAAAIGEPGRGQQQDELLQMQAPPQDRLDALQAAASGWNLTLGALS